MWLAGSKDMEVETHPSLPRTRVPHPPTQRKPLPLLQKKPTAAARFTTLSATVADTRGYTANRASTCLCLGFGTKQVPPHLFSRVLPCDLRQRVTLGVTERQRPTLRQRSSSR